MNDRMRHGLGLLVLAVVAVLVALMTRGAADGDSIGASVNTFATLIAVILGLAGLGYLAAGLLKRTD